MNAENQVHGSLTPARGWLVQQMRRVDHGTIYDLHVRAGDPALVPPPKIRRACRLGSKPAIPADHRKSLALKKRHIELFDLFDQIHDGLIQKIHVQDGLPFQVEWEEATDV